MKLVVVALSVLVSCITCLHVPVYNNDGVFRMAQNSHDQHVSFGQKSHDKQSNDQGIYKSSRCGEMVENYRFDCYPEGDVTQALCEARGCCYTPASQRSSLGREINVPWCYFPPDYPDYAITKYQRTLTGYSLTLTRDRKTNWPGDIMTLQVKAIFETRNRIHIKIYDPTKVRYEVPIETPDPPTKAEMGLGIEFNSQPFGFSVGGMGGGSIMDTNLVGAPLIFSDQFIQFSTRLPTPYIYGLGEHKEHLLINASSGWQQRAFWTRDMHPEFGDNLYGVHPFYMGVMPAGEFQEAMSYGLFFLNSNAMEIDIQPMPSLTFRTIGGILDFYVFYGFSPDEVIQQYTEVIGRPFLPPYWALGFHLCRYGYGSSKRLKEIIDRNRAIGFPYDVQWNDIDYMDSHLDWTYDHKAYDGLPGIVDNLHSNHMKYVIIVDPGISVKDGYDPYDDGLKMDIFIKNATGQPIIGKVWPGDTLFPDFTHPDAPVWWYKHAKSYHDQVKFDGLWTDMNEPSNFVSGSKYGCTNNSLDNPPYTPGVLGNSLAGMTLCPSAQQHLSTHYNLHNMYGYFEVKASHDVLINLTSKRPLVISRSTFPSTGRYGGHWSGDVSSTWEDLRYSIPEMLRFQLFGIPLVGADICGFGDRTTEELCTRWMQLGAFYPFMRNHNDQGEEDQDPAFFSPSAQSAMKSATELRYSLLPYLYTLFVASHMNGTTVARPYFFVYPKDPETVSIDEQFFWGDGLLISPVLTQNALNVKAYFNPNDTFYDIYDGTPITNGGWQTIDAPMDKINVHIRGGSIIPTLPSAVTTAKSREGPFCLLVAIGTKRVEHFVPKPKPHRVYVNVTYAAGEMYWDDGESLDSIESVKFNHVMFKATKDNITSSVEERGYTDPHLMSLTSIKLMGVTPVPTKVMVNSKVASIHVQKSITVIDGFTASLMEPLLVTWS